MEVNMSSQSHEVANRAGRFPVSVDKVFETILAVILFIELFILFGNIVLREFFHIQIIWADEADSMSLVAISFLGGAVAFYEGKHLSVRMLVDKLPKCWQSLIDSFVNWLVMLLSILCFVYIMPVFKENRG